MIVRQGKLDERVVYTSIGIGDVQPSYGQRPLVMSSQLDDSCELCLMLSYPRDRR